MLDPPYDRNRYAVWHQHFTKRYGRFSFDAVEDDLGRVFVWDADAEQVLKVCTSREEAIRDAKKRAAE